MRRYEKPQKAHIYFAKGYWKVVHMPPKSWSSGIGAALYANSFKPAHEYCTEMNNGRYDQLDYSDRKERLLAPWRKSDAKKEA